MFNPNEIEQLKKIIDGKVKTFVAKNISPELLSSSERRILRELGVDIKSIKPEQSMIYQSFAFGVMSGAIPKSQLNKLSYKDFVKYINSDQFIPLTTGEKARIKSLEQQTLKDVRGIQNRFEDYVEGEAVSANRRIYEDTIRREITEGQARNESLRVISNNISKQLGDFGRSFDKTVQYVSHSAFQEGRAAFAEKNGGENAKGYFDVFPGGCKNCIRLYLTDGIGSQPKVFKVDELRANGNNIGLKVNDWKPTLYSTHPYCRCTFNFLPEGYAWDEEKKRFAPSKTERKVERKSKVGIKFGDEEYTI